MRVAECLYHNESSSGYYALVKKPGKQIRRSLKTTDRKLAERHLRDFREQLTGLDLSKDQANICCKEAGLKSVKKFSYSKIMSEIIFEVVEDEINGGYSTSALGY